MHSRRSFLKTGAATLAATSAVATTARPLLAQLGRTREPVPAIQDDRIKALADRAIDTARTAGASYADVRLVHTRMRYITGSASDFEWMTVGVRALTNGYWGFAGSPVWSADEMVQLARQAVAHAKVGSLGRTRSVSLAPVAQPANGHWDMPVEIDPFTVPVGEIIDYKDSLERYAAYRATARGYGFRCQNSQSLMSTRSVAFGSTEGSYCTQRLFRTTGIYDWMLEDPAVLRATGQHITIPIRMDYLPWSGMGWELYRGQPLRDYIDRLIEESIEDIHLPHKLVDVGRYDTVWDASSVAQLTSATIGVATEIDRVFGDEANATGTSYLNAPFDMLGAYRIGPSFLTVTGNRNQPGGVATVKWDDDGVTPHEFQLVSQGRLNDLSTTRESASWIAEYYAKTGKDLQSHGCAFGGQDIMSRGINIPVACTPNLTITPSDTTLDFDGCIAGVSKGIAFRGLQFDMDFQQSGGLGSAAITYEIRNGKRVAILDGAGTLFRATELWKTLTTLGGATSQRRFAVMTTKGEPPQLGYHSVWSVPAVFQQTSIIDVLRKA